MDIKYFPEKNTIVLSGLIEEGDSEKAQKVFSEAKNGFEILLSSPGGALLEAIEIGKLVDKYQNLKRQMKRLFH